VIDSMVICGDSTYIHRHTYPHKVTFHKHLGSERHSELHLLLERDIVFTTFATAAAEFKEGRSPLSSIHWFRIVLDEGEDRSWI
jgi:SWI/SNF-related matrix-associated actin-dependent regulator of chromatin subfamily A3